MRTFKRSTTTAEWPEPTCTQSEIKDLSNLELADYIASCGPDYDGMSNTFREAVVRLLLYHQGHMPPKRIDLR